jgi:hypothetical protein
MQPTIKAQILSNEREITVNFIAEDTSIAGYQLPDVVIKDINRIKGEFFRGGHPPNTEEVRENLKMQMQHIINLHVDQGHLDFLPGFGFTHQAGPKVMEVETRMLGEHAMGLRIAVDPRASKQERIAQALAGAQAAVDKGLAPGDEQRLSKLPLVYAGQLNPSPALKAAWPRAVAPPPNKHVAEVIEPEAQPAPTPAPAEVSEPLQPVPAGVSVPADFLPRLQAAVDVLGQDRALELVGSVRELGAAERIEALQTLERYAAEPIAQGRDVVALAATTGGAF